MVDDNQDKKTICETCEHCAYDVLPNKFLCTKEDNLIEVIVVVLDQCPVGKW